ncbi:MAG: autotransporter translocation and assembly factor TamB [Cocleimonas sp.]|jgi:autotransporter translocation and assembly factor TamB
MRQHLNQYVFSPLFWIMSLLLVGLFLLVLLLFTPIGPKAIAYIADSSIEELSLKGVTGSVLTGLHVDEFAWNANVGIVLKDINVSIDSYDIENKKIYADKLIVGELAIMLEENTSEPKSSDDPIELPDFGLPINIDANQLQLDSLQIIKKIPVTQSASKQVPDTQSLLFQIEGILLNKAVIKDGKLTFESLQGAPTILDQPLKIDVANGSLDMNKPHEVNTSGAISFKHPTLGELGGDIVLGGTLTNYIFDSDLVFRQKEIGEGTLVVNGEGDYKNVTLKSIDVVSIHGNAEANGNVSWDPEIRLAFDVDAKQLNTKKLLPEWPVTANTKIKYEGSFIDSRLENKINILSLDGDLKGQIINGKGLIVNKPDSTRAENLSLQLGDNTLIASGAVTEPLNLELSINAANLKQILPELAGEIKGSAVIKGEYKAPQVESKLTLKNLAYGDFKQSKETIFLDTDVGLEENELKIKNIIAKIGENQVKLIGKATEPFDLEWNIDAKNLAQVSPLISGRIKGGGVLKGTQKIPSTSFELNANQLVYNDLRQGEESFNLVGEIALDESIIQIKSLLAKSGTNSINVSGLASDPLALELKINAQMLSEVSPDITGRVTGTGSIKGPYKSPMIITNLLGSNVSFKQQRFTSGDIKLQGEAQIVEGVPIIKQLNTQVGNNSFLITGRASSPFDLSWNVDGKNLEQILPEMAGSLIVKGKLQGTIEKPIIDAIGTAKNLKYKTFSLRSADLSASTNNGFYRIKADLKKLKNEDQKIDAAQAELNGTIENHAISAKVDHSEGKLNLQANGGWQNQRWSGILKTLKLGDTQAGDWQLQKPSKISLSADGFSADSFCLKSDKTQACSTASYAKASGLMAKGTLQKTPLKLLKPFLPEGMTLNGDIEGSYDIKQNGGKPTGKIKFKLPKSSFSIVKEDGEEESFSYEDAEVSATINNKTINAEAKAKIIGKGAFTSKAKIKLSPENGKHTIDGVANFDIPNINFAQSLVPRTRGLRGALNSKLTFSGLLTKPQIIGQAKLVNGYLRLPEAGTEITNINLNVVANEPGKAIINGKMLMGKGALNVSGDMNLKDIKKWQANIKISGNNILFMNNTEVRAFMSPDITINLTPKVVSVQGKVVIPEADIRLNAIPESSINESSDTFVIGETKPGENLNAVKIKPNVLIQLGDKVRMDAFGLEAKLSGDIRVGHNRRDITANGSLRVQDGKFQAYGQDLAIDNGRLIFNGSPKLVGIDVRATRTINKQIVGIHLGGNVLSPKSEIFSDPLIEESEALSYLLTGNSLSSASGQESALLLSAVRGLGITGNGSIVQKIGASFGLDDVNIVTGSDLKDSELALGKRLGSRLYVRYLIGLFDQTQKIAIEYKINDVLSLEAQTTAEDFGLDFIYEIETD